MGRLIDLTGQRFGRLTVVERAKTVNGTKARWRCICVCGNIVDVDGDKLRRSETHSCGCHKRELLGDSRRKYKDADMQLLHIWQGMIGRCYVKSNSVYQYYGGKGITVCAEWRNSYFLFELWAKDNGFRPGYEIDRIDFNGNYRPDNCRFVDRITQANNTARNVFLSYGGETLTIAQWARKLGVTYATLHNRYRRGWSVERILSK